MEGKSGFLVDPNNVEELAAVLHRLVLDQELRRNLGAAGLRRVQSEFNWRKRAELLRELNLAITLEHASRKQRSKSSA